MERIKEWLEEIKKQQDGFSIKRNGLVMSDLVDKEKTMHITRITLEKVIKILEE